jgi:hypothetical protein
MRRVCVFLPLLLLLACEGPEQSVGHILVVAQPLTTAAQLSRVTVTITPAGITQDLTVDPQDPSKFSGTIAVPVGAQTVLAEAFVGLAKVGSGTATVTVAKGVQMQAQITILDITGPSPGPDHSPVVTSLVTPASVQAGDQPTLTAAAMDADGDSMTFAWDASPSGCGTFTSPTAPSTTFTAGATLGTCTVRFTVNANGKSDSRSAPIQIVAATGTINIQVTYVPQPLISSIAFTSGSTQIASVQRTASDATIRAAFHKGAPYTVTLSFDPWPNGTLALSDSCGGTIVQPVFAPNAPSATATWTPTVDSGACMVTATLSRQTLVDNFFVVVLPVP